MRQAADQVKAQQAALRIPVCDLMFPATGVEGVVEGVLRQEDSFVVVQQRLVRRYRCLDVAVRLGGFSGSVELFDLDDVGPPAVGEVEPLPALAIGADEGGRLPGGQTRLEQMP